jgi:hypothetical protein
MGQDIITLSGTKPSILHFIYALNTRCTLAGVCSAADVHDRVWAVTAELCSSALTAVQPQPTCSAITTACSSARKGHPQQVRLYFDIFRRARGFTEQDFSGYRSQLNAKVTMFGLNNLGYSQSGNRKRSPELEKKTAQNSYEIRRSTVFGRSFQVFLSPTYFV